MTPTQEAHTRTNPATLSEKHRNRQALNLPQNLKKSVRTPSRAVFRFLRMFLMLNIYYK